jgi:photosystem II stability/assembly factor-like uncharacterized protein
MIMKYLLYLLFVGCAISCLNSKDVPFSEVKIIPVFTDSLSIRAIVPMDENTVWFAANRGVVGLIDGTTPKLATIKYQDSILNFRAISKTATSVFVLSIETPAVLYKIDHINKGVTKMTEVYVEENKKVFYDSMAFFDENEGIAMGDPTDTCLSIIKTTDGGKTWQKLSCEILPEVHEGEAAFAASNSNIAIYNDHVWMVSGGKKARVFHSKNKGATWEVYNTPIIQGQTMTGIYSVDFYDENLGVSFGGNWEDKDFNEGNKAITEDGGKTWQLLSNGRGPGYRSSVKFVPGTKGHGLIAVGSPGISYSSNRGIDWSDLSDQGFYALEFVNDSVAFASGNNIIAKLVFK